MPLDDGAVALATAPADDPLKLPALLVGEPAHLHWSSHRGQFLRLPGCSGGGRPSEVGGQGTSTCVGEAAACARVPTPLASAALSCPRAPLLMSAVHRPYKRGSFDPLVVRASSPTTTPPIYTEEDRAVDGSPRSKLQLQLHDMRHATLIRVSDNWIRPGLDRRRSTRRGRRAIDSNV